MGFLDEKHSLVLRYQEAEFFLRIIHVSGYLAQVKGVLVHVGIGLAISKAYQYIFWMAQLHQYSHKRVQLDSS